MAAFGAEVTPFVVLVGLIVVLVAVIDQNLLVVLFVAADVDAAAVAGDDDALAADDGDDAAERGMRVNEFDEKKSKATYDLFEEDSMDLKSLDVGTNYEVNLYEGKYCAESDDLLNLVNYVPD